MGINWVLINGKNGKKLGINSQYQKSLFLMYRSLTISSWVWNFHHPWCSANLSDFKNSHYKEMEPCGIPLKYGGVRRVSFKNVTLQSGLSLNSALWVRLAVWSVASWAVDKLKIIWAIAVDKHKIWVCFSLPSFLLFFPSSFLPSWLQIVCQIFRLNMILD